MWGGRQSRRLLSLCGFLLAALAAAQDAVAYLYTESDSLEWQVADADLIVRGTFAAAKWRHDPSHQGGLTYRKVILVDVAEILKGPAASDGRLELPTDEYSAYGSLTPERPDAGERLLFLKRSGRLAGNDPAAGDFPWAIESSYYDLVPLDGTRDVLAVTADLRTVKDPRELLARVRALVATAPPGAARPPKPVRVDLHLPADERFPVGDLPDVLKLPLDAPTEARARQWAASDKVALRWMAVRVLRELKSDRNAAALGRMLSDPATLRVGAGARESAVYFLRKQAYETLSRWGHADGLSPPQLERTLVNYRRVNSPGGGVAVPAALCLAVLGSILFVRFALVRRGHWPSPLTALTTASAVLGVAAAALWVSNRWRADELVVTTAGARHRLASVGGALQYARVADWAEPPGLVCGSFPPDCDTELALMLPDHDVYTSVCVMLDGLQNGLGPPSPGVRVAWPPSAERTWRFAGVRLVAGQTPDPTGATRPLHGGRVHYSNLLVLSAVLPAARVARRLANRLRSRRRSRRGLCARCGYNLTGNASGVCPECGSTIGPPKHLEGFGAMSPGSS
jgi:hypothetical protein